MPVDIVPYQPGWPGEFKAIAAELRAALGGLALRIDHIGSTAVPGLAAKDVIDVQITVAELSDAIIRALTAAGYVYRPGRHDHRPPGHTGPDDDWGKLVFNQPAGRRQTHVHVRVQGRANQRFALLFRDYARAHPAAAEAYAELKRRLAAHMPDTRTYAEVKDPAIDLLMLAAEAWARPGKAASIGWEVGPSDG